MGKTIVITGAGDGLGRALARRFAADGETVILLGRTLSKVEAVAAELGAPHLALACEVSDPASVAAAFAEIARHFPKIDVLINNAAVYEPFTLAEVRDDQIMGHALTNFVGPIFVTRAALPLFQGDGHVINVSSESTQKTMPMLWLYASTKAGLELMSHRWAHELEADGIRVTVVRAGQMMDETKVAPRWSQEVAVRFAQSNAYAGNHIRERPISHYNSVTDAFRAVIDMPPDVHIDTVGVGARKRG